MGQFSGTLSSIWRFYRDGFRNMTWGRPLVWLIILKVFILFAVCRLLFFRPAMAGMNEKEKAETVGKNLARSTESDTLTLK